jgi:hypothetical protein
MAGFVRWLKTFGSFLLVIFGSSLLYAATAPSADGSAVLIGGPMLAAGLACFWVSLRKP